MFGFGKNKIRNISADVIEIFNCFHKRENEILESANQIFEKRFNTEYKITTHLFYLSKYYLSPDYMGYALGFFEGMCQGKGYENDNDKTEFLVIELMIF